MIREESVWIRNVLEEADLSSVNDVLDIGSSTKEFRTEIQPYIDDNVLKPLRKQNKFIYYLDQKTGDGIDLVFDIENVTADEIGKKFDLVICCNVIEHVRKPKELACLLAELVKENRFLLVTVPHTYRYHPDPIDTMFRPSIMELISMFPGMEVIRKDTIQIREKERYCITELIRYFVPYFRWKVNCLFMKKGNV